MRNLESATDTILLSVGSVYSLANIEHILGIIILAIQIVWFSIKLSVKIYRAIKRKTATELLSTDDPNLDLIFGEEVTRKHGEHTGNNHEHSKRAK